MERLLWMLPCLPLVLPAAGELPMPVNVTLVSGGSDLAVKWKPGAGTPDQAFYRVSITTERSASEDVVSGCERVQHQLLCNLSDAFSDPMETYILMIRAVLDEQVSRPANPPRFQPLHHMSLPLLTVTPCGRNLCVELLPPAERYRETYDTLHYRLRIESGGKDPVQYFMETWSLRGETLKDLTPGRQYCVSVTFWDFLEETNSNFSRPVCASTPAVTSADPWIAAGLCLVVIALMIILSLLAFTGFICLRRMPLPLVLASIRHAEESVVVPCSSSLSSLWNVKPCDAKRMSTSSSSDHSDQECATEDSDQSGSSANKLKGGVTGLRSSSSSFYKQPEPKHTDFSASQSEILISASTSHHSVNPRCTDEEEEGPDEEEDSQDVNLLSLRLGWFDDVENKEKLHSAEEEPAASLALLSPICCAEEGASEGASGCTDEEDRDSDLGYTRRQKIAAVQ